MSDLVQVGLAAHVELTHLGEDDLPQHHKPPVGLELQAFRLAFNKADSQRSLHNALLGQMPAVRDA